MKRYKLFLYLFLCSLAIQTTAQDLSRFAYDDVSLYFWDASGTAGITGRPYGFTVSSDGTMAYIIDDYAKKIGQYDLGTPWELGSAEWHGATPLITPLLSAPVSYITHPMVKPDHSKLYIVTQSPDAIEQFSIPGGDVTSLTYDDQKLILAPGGVDINPGPSAFKTDGSRLFVFDEYRDSLYQYSFSTPWDLSSASYDTCVYISGLHGPRGLNFNSSGTLMYVTDFSTFGVNQYRLAEPWDLSSVSFEINLDVTPYPSRGHYSGYMSPDSQKLYIMNFYDNRIFQWALDETGPSMTITAAQGSDGFTSNDASLALTFISNEPTEDFNLGDISATNGSLSNFQANSSTIYTATLSPLSEGAVSIDVAEAVFTDAAGNNNSAAEQFNWNYDGTSPDIVVTAAEGANGFSSNDASLSLTFTATEGTEDFSADDVTVTNSSLSDFQATSPSVYTATLIPLAEGSISIAVEAETFHDEAGNGNNASMVFWWGYDATGPGMTITAAEGEDGFSSNDAVLSLTFTSGEPTTDFGVDDVTVTNGAVSDFISLSLAVYTATFTPTGEGGATIDVAQGRFTDAVGNSNTAADQFNWSYDTTAPAMTITAAEGADGFSSNDESLSLTFTSSESAVDFTVDDITVTNGALSDFTPSSTTSFTATFTPAGDGDVSLEVGTGVFHDQAGNGNLATEIFNWTYDATAPTMVITAAEGADGFSSNDSSLTLTFTFTEETTDFNIDDIGVTNCSLSDFQTISPTVSSATLIPNSDGAVLIDVAPGSFSDAVGNSNTVPSQFNWTYDGTPPRMTITAAEGTNGFISNDVSLSLTFTSTEATTDFSIHDILVTNGVLNDFLAVSSTEYTATLAPLDDGAVSLNVSGGGFTDAVGNPNTAADQFDWNFDGTAPEVNISAAEGEDGFTSNDAGLTLTFTSTESTADFDIDDISVTNGVLNNFQSSNEQVYTAILSPNSSGEVIVQVEADSFSDQAGNGNAASDEFNWLYDGSAPYIVALSPENGAVGTSVSSDLAITFSENIHVGTGSLTLFDVNGTQIEQFDVASDVLGSGSPVITVEPTANLESGSSYYVLIDVSAFEDSGGNLFPGIIDPATWTFTTAGFLQESVDLTTSESGETGAFTVVLMSEPAADVNLQITSSDESEGHPDIGSMTFTSANWNVPQTVTVTGVDDDRADGDVDYSIILSSATSTDEAYQGLDPDDVLMNNADDDHAGIHFVVVDSVTSEAGDTGAFSVALLSQPSGEVSIAFASTDVTEGNVTGENLVFFESNWNMLQTVTVTGMDDALADGDVPYAIMFENVESADVDYHGLTLGNISLVNLDMEPEVVISPVALEFGSILISEMDSLSFSISNHGNQSLLIDSVALESDIFHLVGFTAPQTLAEETLLDLVLRFSPTDTGRFSTSLFVFSNDPVNPEVEIGISGFGFNLPPEISSIENPELLNTGEGMEISLTVSDGEDGDALTEVAVNYFLGGGSGFQTVIAEQAEAGGPYTATIDSSVIGIGSIAFFIEAQDSYGAITTSDTVSVTTSFPAEVLTTGIPGSAYPDGLPNERWRLISVPTHLDDPSVQATLADELGGSPSDETWRLFSDLDGEDWIEPASLVIGHGYWIQHRQDASLGFATGSGSSVDLTGTAFMVPTGWSLIGNPYPFEVMLDLDESQFFGPLSYGQTGVEGWDAISTTLRPWQGYALFNKGSDSATIAIKPLDSFGEALARPSIEMTDGWQYVFSAHNGEYGDQYTVVGRRSDASDLSDIYDNPKPPLRTPSVSLSLDGTEWGAGPGMATDLRSLQETNGVWELVLEVAGVGGPITLSTKLQGSLPAGEIAVLLDPNQNASWFLEEMGDVVLENVTEGYPYAMTIVVGEVSFVQTTVEGIKAKLPTSFALKQNYPNPFNPSTTIRYALPHASPMELVIYDLKGNIVREFTTQIQTTGWHELTWNGLDWNNQSVPAGIYFARFQTPDFSETIKMVLLK